MSGSTEVVQPVSKSPDLYRFLTVGEEIRAGDECLSDDFARWEPVDRWATRAKFSPVFKPVRRKVGTIGAQSLEGTIMASKLRDVWEHSEELCFAAATLIEELETNINIKADFIERVMDDMAALTEELERYRAADAKRAEDAARRELQGKINEDFASRGTE